MSRLEVRIQRDSTSDSPSASDGTRVAACIVISACREGITFAPQAQATIIGHRGGFAWRMEACASNV